MAGRIRDEDIAQVREQARIDDVVGGYVTLRNAGGGSMKGLCPFHDEKTPSFHVTPSRGFFHCFGCGEGGDVINFLMKHDGLSFGEAVEVLADRFGVVLRREEGSGAAQTGSHSGSSSGSSSGSNSGPRGPGRSRLIEANRAAQEFYAAALSSPEAAPARTFLLERGFDQGAAETFGVGYAPRDGEALLRHLRGRGFNQEELTAAGLIAIGRSAYDRFRGRLLWPIRGASGETLGFGARRIFDDDKVEAKYLNTPETSLYKKGQVLYGLDLARKDIARSAQAVIVEGYTDVMACHLAGVGTAVATCGTAFGDDHARILRRFMLDHEEFRGEVIFTFDGDAAGQKAALRAFAGDQNFVSQTYVAVEPTGLDPCDLRLGQGDQAVRELVARRVPLYRFVLSNIASKYDLDRSDGRIDALREAAPLVASVRDRSKVDAFARELAAMLGVDVDEARAEVRRASSPRSHRRDARESVAAPAKHDVPNLADARFAIEREVLKLVLQFPETALSLVSEVAEADFMHPYCRDVWRAIVATDQQDLGVGWGAKVRDAAPTLEASSVISALGVEPLPLTDEPDQSYTTELIYRLRELSAMRQINELKSRLQRTNPIEQAVHYNKMFAELVALEQRRRTLRELAVGQ
jgi:DNA primase